MFVIDALSIMSNAYKSGRFTMQYTASLSMIECWSTHVPTFTTTTTTPSLCHTNTLLPLCKTGVRFAADHGGFFFTAQCQQLHYNWHLPPLHNLAVYLNMGCWPTGGWLGILNISENDEWCWDVEVED